MEEEDNYNDLINTPTKNSKIDRPQRQIKKEIDHDEPISYLSKWKGVILFSLSFTIIILVTYIMITIYREYYNEGSNNYRDMFHCTEQAKRNARFLPDGHIKIRYD